MSSSRDHRSQRRSGGSSRSGNEAYNTAVPRGASPERHLYAYNNPIAYEYGLKPWFRPSHEGGSSGSDDSSHGKHKSNKFRPLVIFLAISLVLSLIIILGLSLYFGLMTDDENTTPAPKTPRVMFPQMLEDPDFEGTFKLSNTEWDPAMTDMTSDVFRDTASRMETTCDQIFSESGLSSVVDYNVVSKLSKGSVEVHFKTYFLKEEDVTDNTTRQLIIEAKQSTARVNLEFKSGLASLKESQKTDLDPMLDFIEIDTLVVQPAVTTPTPTTSTSTTTTSTTTASTTTPSTTTASTTTPSTTTASTTTPSTTTASTTTPSTATVSTTTPSTTTASTTTPSATTVSTTTPSTTTASTTTPSTTTASTTTSTTTASTTTPTTSPVPSTTEAGTTAATPENASPSTTTTSKPNAATSSTTATSTTTTSTATPSKTTARATATKPTTATPENDTTEIKCGEVRVQPDFRIVGGSSALPGDFPWMVMLLKDGYPICGGSIIDKYHILTAVHCLGSVEYENGNYGFKQNTNGIEIVAGKHHRVANTSFPLEQRLPLAGSYIHERFLYRYQAGVLLLDNDIALLRLASPLSFNSRVSPICLPEATSTVPKRCVVAGWGTTSSGYYANVPEELLSVTVRAYDREECLLTFDASFHENIGGSLAYHLTSGTMCAANITEAPVDSCQGDSGGPLFCLQDDEDGEGQHYSVFGLVSYGYGCAIPGVPGFYVNVPYHRTWIDNTAIPHLNQKHPAPDNSCKKVANVSVALGTCTRNKACVSMQEVSLCIHRLLDPQWLMCSLGDIEMTLRMHLMGSLNLCKDFSTRLSGSGGAFTFLDNSWLVVCGDHWEQNEASVLCKQRNHVHGLVQKVPWTMKNLYVSQDLHANGYIHVNCTGTETSLAQCKPDRKRHCSRRFIAATTCYNTEYSFELVPENVDGNYGYVKHTRDDEKGYVCSPSFSDRSAYFLCRELGYIAGMAFGRPMSAPLPGPVWQTDLNCSSEARNINECVNPEKGWSFVEQEKSMCQPARVYCFDSVARFHNDLMNSTGIVQVYHTLENGTVDLRTVCREALDDVDAGIMCRQSGFPDGGQSVSFNPFFVPRTSIYMSVQCDGDETALDNCTITERKWLTCTGPAVARCVDSSSQKPADLSVKLSWDMNQVMVYAQGQWGTICADRWTYSEAMAVCQQLGYPYGYVNKTQLGRYWPHVLHSVHCPNDAVSLTNCTSKDVLTDECQHVTAAAVTCSHVSRPVWRLGDDSRPNVGLVHMLLERFEAPLLVKGSESLASRFCQSLGYIGGQVYLSDHLQANSTNYTTFWTARTKNNCSTTSVLDCFVPNTFEIISCPEGSNDSRCSEKPLAVYCYARPVRVHLGSDNTTGILEIYRQGQWWAPCEQDLSQSAFNAFCRELMNSTSAGAIKLTNSENYFSFSTITVNRARFQDNCSVNGYDQNKTASECLKLTSKWSSCGSYWYQAAVVCYDGTRPSSSIQSWALGADGRVLVKRYGSWGTTCSSTFYNAEARAFCKNFGYSSGYQTSVRSDGRPRWIRNVNCYYESWDSCYYYRTDSSVSCSSSYDAVVRCSNPSNSTTTSPYTTRSTTPYTTRSTTPFMTTTPLPDVTPGPGGDTCGEVRTARPNTRIVGGTQAGVGDYPWMAMLLLRGDRICGGTVIYPDMVITAAHCVDSISRNSQGMLLYPSLLEIIAGKHLTALTPVYSSEQRVRVKAARIHQRYKLDYGFSSNDIALLQLERPLVFNSRVAALCLPEPTAKLPEMCVLAGWGRDGGGNNDYGVSPPHLMVVDTEVANRSECIRRAALESLSVTFAHHTMCSANFSYGGIGGCKGDSGGPVACLVPGENRYQLMGIASWVIIYCRTYPNYPTAHTFVPGFRDWIDLTKMLFEFDVLKNNTCFSPYMDRFEQAEECLGVVSTLPDLNSTQSCSLYRGSLECIRRATDYNCSAVEIHDDLKEYVELLVTFNTSSHIDVYQRLYSVVFNCSGSSQDQNSSQVCGDQSLAVAIATSSLCHNNDSSLGPYGSPIHDCFTILPNMTQCTLKMLSSVTLNESCDFNAVQATLVSNSDEIAQRLNQPLLNFAACADQCLGISTLVNRGLCVYLLQMAANPAYSLENRCRFVNEAFRCAKVQLRVNGYSCSDQSLQETFQMYLEYAPIQNLTALATCAFAYPNVRNDPPLCENGELLRSIPAVSCSFYYYTYDRVRCVMRQLQRGTVFCEYSLVYGALTNSTTSTSTTPSPPTSQRPCDLENSQETIKNAIDHRCSSFLNQLAYITNTTKQCSMADDALTCATWAANYAGYGCERQDIINHNVTALTAFNDTCTLDNSQFAPMNMSVCNDVEVIRMYMQHLCSLAIQKIFIEGPFCSKFKAIQDCTYNSLIWYTGRYCYGVDSVVNAHLKPDVYYLGYASSCSSESRNKCAYFPPWDNLFSDCHDSFGDLLTSVSCDNLWSAIQCTRITLLQNSTVCETQEIADRLMNTLTMGHGNHCRADWPTFQDPCVDPYVIDFAIKSCMLTNCIMCCEPLEYLVNCVRNWYSRSGYYCYSSIIHYAIMRQNASICREKQPTLDEAGRVYVNRYNYLRPMCGDLWSDKEAMLVCRQAGYTHGVAVHRPINIGAIPGHYSQNWLSYALCIPGQMSLEECWIGSDRSCSKFHASVYCYNDNYTYTLVPSQPGSLTGTIRLSGDDGEADVCVTLSLGMREAHVLCTAAGFVTGMVSLDSNETAKPSYVWQLPMACNRSAPDVVACLESPYIPQFVPAASSSCVIPKVTCSNDRGSLYPPGSNLGLPNITVYEPLSFDFMNFLACRTNFTDVEAKVLCKGLGYASGGQALNYNPFYPYYSSNIALVRCNGDEEKIDDCQINRHPPYTYCRNPAVVLCNDTSAKPEPPMPVKLGPMNDLQIYYEGLWGTVCADNWTRTEADVMCKELYNTTGIAWESRGPARILPQLVANLTCSGNESSWTQCEFSPVSSDYCQYKGSTILYCQRDVYQYNLTGGMRDNYGWMWIQSTTSPMSLPALLQASNLSSIFYNALCQEMGYYGGGVYQGNLTLPGNNSSTIWEAEYHPQCFYATTPTWVDQCRSSDWQTDTCSWDTESAGLKCADVAAKVYCHNSPVRMHDSFTSRTGIVQLLFQGRWREVCSSGLSNTTANVLCRDMMGSSTARAVMLPSSRVFRNYYSYYPLTINSTCTSSDTKVSDCIMPDSRGYCSSTNFLSLACYEYSKPTGGIQGWKIDDDNRVMVKRYGVWGAVCSYYWGTYEGRTLCKTLNMTYSSYGSTYDTPRNMAVWVHSVDCYLDDMSKCSVTRIEDASYIYSYHCNRHALTFCR